MARIKVLQQNMWGVLAAWTVAALPVQAQQREAVPAPNQVIVTGKQTDTEARRDFVAGKIIITRKRIEQSGMEHVDELLKREPAVTVSADGRVGLLGLPGYTQVLIDGAPPDGGQGIAQLKLVRVEKIEIVKSAIAEYGPFGIAGTINIITRKAQRATNTRIGLSGGASAGQPKAGMSFAHDESRPGSPLRYGISVDANQTRSDDKSEHSLVQRDPDQVIWTGPAARRGRSSDAGMSTELVWNPDKGQILRLAPNGSQIASHHAIAELRSYAGGALERAHIASRTTLSMANLPLTWTVKPTSKSELELKLRASRISMATRERRLERSVDGNSLRDMSREALAQVRQLELRHKAKLSKAHDVKLGGSVLHTRETVEFLNRIDSVPDTILDVLGSERRASNRQTRVFAQDDWRLSETLAVNLGLTGQHTAIDLAQGDDESRPRFRLWSPSLHVLKDFGDDDATRQLRVSVARSYKAPDLEDLALRPIIHPLAPCTAIACGANTIETLDSAGNPALRPESALGINLAYEYGIGSDSTLTLEVYARRIGGKIGSLITQETVPWSTVPRYVSRPANLGDARAQGVNLEMELAVRELLPTAPKVYLRGALNLASSKVTSLQGPDNKLDKQTPWSAKLGGSYQLQRMPLKVDLDASWSPGVWIRSNSSQRISIDRSFVLNGRLAWTIAPDQRLQLGVNNFMPRSTQSIHEYEGGSGVRELANRTHTHRSFTLRFDTKL